MKLQAVTSLATALALVLLSVPALPPSAHAGSSIVAGGGDAIAQDFVKVADEALRVLRELQAAGNSEFANADELGRLQKLLHDSDPEQRLDFNTEPRLYLYGEHERGVKIDERRYHELRSDPATAHLAREVDAINYAELRLIYLSQSRWPLKHGFEKAGLVYHELLGLLSKADPGYALSQKFVRHVTDHGLFPDEEFGGHPLMSIFRKLESKVMFVQALKQQAQFVLVDDELQVQLLPNTPFDGEANVARPVSTSFESLCFKLDYPIALKIPGSDVLGSVLRPQVSFGTRIGSFRDFCVLTPEALLKEGRTELSFTEEYGGGGARVRSNAYLVQ